MTTGSVSPTGRPHPGAISFDDEVEGRQWTRQASEVPQSIAWVDVQGVWQAVTRIISTGTIDERHITRLGEDGGLLDVTMQAPPPRTSPEEPIVPQPAPDDDD